MAKMKFLFPSLALIFLFIQVQPKECTDDASVQGVDNEKYAGVLKTAAELTKKIAEAVVAHDDEKPTVRAAAIKACKELHGSDPLPDLANPGAPYGPLWEPVLRAIKECADESEVDDASRLRINNGDFSVDNEKSRKYAVCLMKKLKALTKEDAIDPEVLAMNAREDDKPMVRAAAEACKQLHGDDIEAKVWNFLVCFKEYAVQTLERLESKATA